MILLLVGENPNDARKYLCDMIHIQQCLQTQHIPRNDHIIRKYAMLYCKREIRNLQVAISASKTETQV